MARLPILPAASNLPFPPVEKALRDPDGLLCAGADLSSERLLDAYQRGIFPWFGPGEPILWWSPDPRCVFMLESLKVPSRLRRFARQCDWRISADESFEQVMRACAEPRGDGHGTWIGAQMLKAYAQLHQLGHAHSVEIWEHGELIGGIYGIAIGRVFFGESMFSRRSNASKLALMLLAQQLRDWGFVMMDGQVQNPHLISLGAQMITRERFCGLLATHCGTQTPAGNWSERWTLTAAEQLN